MSSRDPESSRAHDYTEGASAIDIEEAIRYRRRDDNASHYHDTLYGEGTDSVGAMFSGPGHSINPSSVSRMERAPIGRRSSDDAWSRRRLSMDSRASGGRRSRAESRDSDQVSRQSSVESESGEDSIFSEQEEGRSSRAGRSRRRMGRKDADPVLSKSGVFEGLANFFGRQSAADTTPHRARRHSISQRSSASSQRSRRSRLSQAGSEAGPNGSDGESGDEHWGYSSGEDESQSEEGDVVSIRSSMMGYDSNPPSPGDNIQGLPLLAPDPMFGGDTRVDMGLADLPPPPPGAPSRQTIALSDEKTTLRFVGYETIRWRRYVWRAGCVGSLGILGLLGHWFPTLWLRWVAREKAFVDIDQGFVIVESMYRDVALFPLDTLEYPYPLSTIFTPSSVRNASIPSHHASSRRTSITSASATKASIVTEEPGAELRLVDCRYSRFVLNPKSGLFEKISDWRDPLWTGRNAVKNGLEPTTRSQRYTLFGRNEIDIQGKSVPQLLIDEIIHPFYVFQVASIILWTLDNYYYYAFCIFLISVLSITSTLIDTRKTIARMREMSRFSCQVDVYFDGAWNSLESTALVPGDIVNLSSCPPTLLPADIFLLSGDTIVNESMLTGESVPVSKIPVIDEELAKWKGGELSTEAAKSFLHSGTKIIRVRGAFAADGSTGTPAVGLVVRTGFNTTKGALVRSMLYPKPMGFSFYRDSMRFIGVLAIVAGLGFLASVTQFVRLGVSWHTILLRALDLITVVVPPALPATLSIGTGFALTRLKKKGVLCVAPSRVNVAGKVNVCCFDKTGTLTEDGLDILGVRATDSSRPGQARNFSELLSDVRDIPSARTDERAVFLHALATCHALRCVNGEVVGDPLDVRMFEFTRWTVEEGEATGGVGMINKGREGERATALVQNVVRPPGSGGFRVEDALRGSSKHAHFLELGVVRTFDFVPALRRMSVVVKRLKSTSMEIYVKGAPEVMREICEPDSFPQDYEPLLSYYTKRGYRVIAIAGKSIPGLTWLRAQRLKRESAESSLRFLGLVIFENRVREGSPRAIGQLRGAGMACRMITGDNPLTAVSVGRECGIIGGEVGVFAPSLVGAASAARGGSIYGSAGECDGMRVEWKCMEDPGCYLDSYTLKPIGGGTNLSGGMGDEDRDGEHHDYAVVVTGDVFRWMVHHAPLETLQRMLVKTQIFARMAPDEKNEVVERLQGLGYTVLMCGDGANDCAALKAADVGIALSEAEASVAAPFTSAGEDVGCVVEVIREGRAALVTSFSCFKYMALYSLIQFTTITLLYSFASSLGDFQFLYIDLFTIIPVAVTMGRTLPYHQIHPKRPTASLVSKKVLTSIGGQAIITSGIQFWAYFWVRTQEWYTLPKSGEDQTKKGKLTAENYENSVLFLISCFQYILVAAVFSIGPPYRQPIYTNGWLMLALIVLGGINLMLLLNPPQAMRLILELMDLPWEARWVLAGAVLVNIGVSLAFEKWGTGLVSDLIGMVVQTFRGRRRVRKGKEYKVVESGM